MDLDLQQLGARLTQLRELRGKSLSGLAEDAGIAKSYLAKLEKGDVENPGLKTLSHIAHALGVTVADLIEPAGEVPTRSESALLSRHYEEIIEANLPESLRAFIREEEGRTGRRVPADVVRALAVAQFRGKRPQRKEDWLLLYHTLRSVSRP